MKACKVLHATMGEEHLSELALLESEMKAKARNERSQGESDVLMLSQGYRPIAQSL